MEQDALRNPGVFGTAESWSGYFQPLHDGPFDRPRRRLPDLGEKQGEWRSQLDAGLVWALAH